MSFTGEFVSEIPEGVLDGAEDFVIGEVNQFVRQAFENSVCVTAQGGEYLLATVFAFWSGRVRGGGGFVQQGNLPGVKSSVSLKQREPFPAIDSK